ncbi:MAG: molybdopterin-binding protein [Ectothiorhodospiraceae bacterium]|jgi:molybdopterin molybdotransferase
MSGKAEAVKRARGCGHDAPAMSVDDALQRIRDVLAPVSLDERVALRDALGRVLGERIVSTVDVPASDNSAMDGYAVRGDDLASAVNEPLRLVGEAFAGHPYDGTVSAGECVRIMTGGVVPDGTDTVVMQERVRREEELIWIGEGHRRGQHVRYRGEDLAAGQTVLEPGRRLTAPDLGLLASLGVPEVRVRRRVRVAFFSTGDELKSVGEQLDAGDVYDSNRYTLHAMLQRFGADILDLGVVGDDAETLAATLDRACRDADVVVTTGGVSVGEADHITPLLAERGDIGFWSVNMKPGRPLAFGRLGSAAFFGLPGNPVSVMVTFYQIVLPALEHVQGMTPTPRLRLRARSAEHIRQKSGRREFQRGVLTTATDGTPEVRITGMQGSGILRSMSEANCFVIVPEDSEGVEPGTWVDVEPFAGLV